MSWGERSCKLFGSCKHDATIATCNVDCVFYVHDGKTTPDSRPALETIPGSSPRTAGIKLPTVGECRKPRCLICGKAGWCSCGYGPEHNHEIEP